jgi:replicative DNA helicase
VSVHVPPHDANAEKSVIASLLLDPARLDEVIELVTPDSFYFQVAGRIFRAIQTLADAGKPVDSVTVYEKLESSGKAQEGDMDWMIDAMNCVPHAAHARHYATIVAERSIRRRLLFASNDAVAAAYAVETDIDETLAQADQKICGLIETRAGGCESTDLTGILYETLQQLQSGVSSGVSTGFTGLDNLGCTLKPGTLTIVAARSSCGKTSFAGNVALNLARSEVAVLFVSLEQNRHELAARFLSSESRVPNLVAGRYLNQGELARLMEGASALQSLPLHIDDTSPRTVSQIAAVARLAKRRHGIGCVVVDYLQIVDPESRKTPREQQVAEITRGLRNIARNLEIPVVTLAQLNRGIETREDKRPRLSDLRESGAIEQDADMVWFIDRPATYREDADPREAHVIIGKHRNGRTGSVPMDWDAATMTFRDAVAAPPDSVTMPAFGGDDDAYEHSGMYSGSLSQF